MQYQNLLILRIFHAQSLNIRFSALRNIKSRDMQYHSLNVRKDALELIE